MDRLKRTATTFSLFAELSHVFYCGLPVFFAVMGAGSQISVGGVFLTFHKAMHDYERAILIGSGLFLAVGLSLHIFSYWIDRRTSSGSSEAQSFRVDWLFATAILLYVANISFYVASGDGYGPPRFN